MLRDHVNDYNTSDIYCWHKKILLKITNKVNKVNNIARSTYIIFKLSVGEYKITTYTNNNKIIKVNNIIIYSHNTSLGEN